MQLRTQQLLGHLQVTEEHIHRAIAMFEREGASVQLLYQIIAAQRALTVAKAIIVSNHIENCTRSILKNKLPERRLDTVQSLIDLYSAIN